MLRHRLPILVTGIAGVAGYSAFRRLRSHYPDQVVGIRPHQNWRLEGPGIVAQDAEDPEGMRLLFERFGFRSVLNAIGNCALKSCELDPTMARRINVDSALVTVDNARRHDARVVHLSSDLVFSGNQNGNHAETDPTDPVTIYGKTMVEAENAFLTLLPQTAVLRISLPMGPSFNRHAGAIDWIDSRFRAGRPATLYYDEVRSCTYVDDLDRVFERFLAGDEAGLYHLGGPRPNTLFEIAQIVNRVAGYAPELLNGCYRIEAGPMPPRAGNVTMNSEKLTRLFGDNPFQPWPLGEDLHPTDRRWHFERPDGELRSLEEMHRRLYGHRSRRVGAAI